MVAGKRQVISSLVHIASSAEYLRILTVTDDCVKRISFDEARVRTSSTAAATAKAMLDKVNSYYVKIAQTKVARISELPFSSSSKNSDGAQRHTRPDKSAMSIIIVRCNDHFAERLQSPMLAPNWNFLLPKAYRHVITHDKRTTAHITTSIDGFVGQMSGAMERGASGPEAFILRRHVLTTHFDGVDMAEDYTKLHNFGVCNGAPFRDFNRGFCVIKWALTK